MAKEKIQLTERQLRKITKSVILEAIANGEIDEGRLGNFFNSLGGGAKEWWRNGGVDAFKQGYNQTMADKSANDAGYYRSQVNAGYKNIPGADAITKKYDGKIAKLSQQSQSIKQEIAQLSAQKKEELQSLRRKHMSKMTSQANKFGNISKNAAANAQDAQNRRRASLGLDNIQPNSNNPAQANKPKMRVAESTNNQLDKIIREAIDRAMS